jgi:hypothetical protein
MLRYVLVDSGSAATLRAVVKSREASGRAIGWQINSFSVSSNLQSAISNLTLMVVLLFCFKTPPTHAGYGFDAMNLSPQLRKAEPKLAIPRLDKSASLASSSEVPMLNDREWLKPLN